MKYLEAKIELRKLFSDYLIEKGFKRRCENQGCEFTKITSFGSLKLLYGIANRHNHVDIGIAIGLSYKVLTNLFNFIYNENNKLNIGWNISSGVSDYFNDINFRYKISSPQDLEKFKLLLKDFYDNYASIFFNQFQTIESLDKLMNSNHSRAEKYVNLEGRIKIGLISAKLNNNPNYSVLREYYFNEVETKFKGYFMYEKCMKVIEFLDQHTSESLNKLADDLEASLLKKGGPKTKEITNQSNYETY